jgi:shikimate dehydrogenase
MLTIAGRNPAKFVPLVNDLRMKDASVRGIALSALDAPFMESIDIIINTTSVGMEPDADSSPLSEDLVFPHHTVFDIVYRPHVTALLRCAEKKGARMVFGADMLLFQGARQFELWTGKRAPVEAMRNALRTVLAS